MSLTLTPWQDTKTAPKLMPEEVHLWRFPLVCEDGLEPLLDEQEMQRARRLLDPEKARSFVVARARLRQILAGYLDLAPQTLKFSYGPAGKPSLAGVADAPAFNLAHSGTWGLCAVVKQGQVGVDIETIDHALDYTKLAERFFSTAENQWLLESPEPRRRRCFFRLWTRKEAWLKGKGGGFSDPEQELSLTHLSARCTHDNAWWLRQVPVAREYLAALAVSRDYSFVKRLNGWFDQAKFSKS